MKATIRSMNTETCFCPEATAIPQKNLRPLSWVRWIVLITVFLVETWIATYQLRQGRLAGVRTEIWVAIAETVPTVMGLFVGALAAAAGFGWLRFRNQLQRYSGKDQSSALLWLYFLANLAAFAGYVALTNRLLRGDADHVGWILAWAVSGVAAIGLLALVFFPVHVWLRLARNGWAFSWQHWGWERRPFY